MPSEILSVGIIVVFFLIFCGIFVALAWEE
jgi:hypothetical protein